MSTWIHPALVKNRGAHDSAQCLDEELLVLLHQLLVEQVAAEDAQPVAAFLGLAAIRVEDAQPERRALRRQRPVQNSV